MTKGMEAAPVLGAEVFEIAKSLSSAADLDDLLEKIGKAAERLSNSEASSILLLTEDKQNLYFRVASGEGGRAIKTMTLPVGQGIAGSVAQTKKPELINDPKSDPRFLGRFDKASGFQTRSLLCVPMIFQNEIVGVLEVLNKREGVYEEKDVEILSSLASLACLSVMNTKILSEQKNFFANMLEILISCIESARPSMFGHPERSARLACAIGRELNVGGQDYRALYYAGLLHDMGYIALKNPRLLELWGVDRPLESMHPEFSVRMLGGIKILSGAIPVISQHHEKFDGTGFPSGARGEEISLGARILGLVEAVEELRQAGGTKDEIYVRALKLAKEGSGTAFDPNVVDAFMRLMENPEEVW